jgi:L-asparaginase
MVPTGDSGITPTLTGHDLIKLLPALEHTVEVVVETPFLKPGASIELAEVKQLVSAINEGQALGYAGAVIVQGTDSIDETSFLLSLLYQGSAPVVVTGAMRGASALSADGPANLFAAISTAASPEARGIGVVVVLNDEIHAAHSVEKMHKGLVSSFESPNGGPLGYFFENTVHVIRHPALRPARVLEPSQFPPVAMIKVGLGSDATLIDALPSLGYDGVVVEAMGVGHVPAKLASSLGELCSRMPVVLASRVAGGPIFHSTYGFDGSEIDLLRRGLIGAEWLSSHKARLLLTTALGAGIDTKELPALFKHFGQP